MAETAVAFLLKELSAFLLFQCQNLGRELQSEVQFIRDELGSMKAFLRDAEAKEDEVLLLQEWVRQVREVAYDTEDVLDEYAMRIAHLDRARGLHGRVLKIYSSIKSLKARRRISSEVRNLKSRVIDISERHKRYQPIYADGQRTGSSSAPVSNPDDDIRASSILIEEAKLVGIENPKRALISQIMEARSRLKVISVLGMGGLGKTTLVKKVFDDLAVKKRFQCHAWLTISQTFNLVLMMKNLIQQLYAEIREPMPSQVTECSDVIRLSEFIKEFVKERRYFLVLDDVWSTDSWDAIRDVLPGGDHGGCIILTTRIADVASASCLGSYDYVHRMKPLPEEESWTLFCDRTFRSNTCPPLLKHVAASILKKCEGLPLAITAISGVLALKDRIDEWELILRSISHEIEGCGKLDRLRKILLLSYNDLPHYLKGCLLYLSIFPEDYVIKMDDLLDRWVAQGLVQEKEGISSSVIAREYANQLINKSLLHAASILPDGMASTCHVHDILRDMIVSKCRELNFAGVATGSFDGRTFDKVRRLAIYDFVDDPQQEDFKHCLKCLRSLEFFGYVSPLSAPALSKFLCGGSKLLKVLDLRGAELEEIPKEVFELYHLKHLGLRYTQVRIIPRSIQKLQNLENLDLLHTNVTEIPVEILKLKKLSSLAVCHLGNYSNDFSLCGFKSPVGIGKLSCLENLRSIEVDNEEIVREIGKLTNLKWLGITKLRREDGKEFICSIAKLTNLKQLSVISIKDDEILDLQYPISPTPRSLKALALQGRLERIPHWVASLECLTILYLQFTGLREEDDATGGIGSLRDLPNLASLSLHHAYEGETLHFSEGFRKLELLELSKITSLKWMRVEKGSMPSLKRLILTGCKQLKELPFGIESLSTLKALELLDLSYELTVKMANLDKESEEYSRISHIAEVCVGFLMNDGQFKAYVI